MEKTGLEFLKKTQYSYLIPSDQMLGRPQPPVELACPENNERIRLPAPGSVAVSHVDLRDAIMHRKSRRSYQNEPITLAELSFLLWCTQGVKQQVAGEYTLRTVPSAGARHALEAYVLVNNVEGVPPGLYRYLAIDHLLAPINVEPEIADKITRACLSQPFVKETQSPSSGQRCPTG